MALSKTGRFLSKAEILGVGVFSPLSKFNRNLGDSNTKLPRIKIANHYFQAIRTNAMKTGVFQRIAGASKI